MRHLSHCLAVMVISVSAVLPIAGNSHAAATLAAYRDEAELVAALNR